MKRDSLVLAMTVGLSGMFVVFPAGAQTVATSTSHRFRSSQPVAQALTGARGTLDRMARQNRTAISVATGDFFEETARGLVTGYALADGGVISVQRGSELPYPDEIGGRTAFAAAATVIDIGMQPDFLQAADINGDGHEDLVVASRKGSAFRVLLGDGKGNFAPQPAVGVGGSIAAIANWRSVDGSEMVATSVCGATCTLQVYKTDGTLAASIATQGQAVVLSSARVNGRSAEDLIVGSDAGVFVVDGSSVGTASPKAARLAVSNAVATAVGSFVYDRRQFTQIAVLTADGTVHTFARTGIVSTPPSPVEVAAARGLRGSRRVSTGVAVDLTSMSWTEVETLQGVALPTGRATPLLMRARISGSGMDDLVAMNVNGGQTTVIRHPVVLVAPAAGSTSSSVGVLAARVEVEATSSGDVAAAVPARVTQDARVGLITAEKGAQPAIVAQPTSGHTYNVNTTTDAAVSTSATAATTACATNTAGCSLRAAVNLVNQHASEGTTKSDVINLQGSSGNPVTYTLGNYGVGDNYHDAKYHLELYGPVNIYGGGAAYTTITVATVSGVPADNLLQENSGYALAEGSAPGDSNAQTAIDFYVSGVTFTNGKIHSSNGAEGTGGLISVDTGGTGNITLVNCNFTNGVEDIGSQGDGGGGAIGVFDLAINDYNDNGAGVQAGPGVFEMDGGLVSGNQAVDDGGAIDLLFTTMLINGVTFSNNQTNPALDTGDAQGNGRGGAIEYQNLCGGPGINCGAAPPFDSLIENSTFTGNTGNTDNNAGTSGNDAAGGAVYTQQGIDIKNSVFTGNKSGNQGGAIYMTTLTTAAVITGNTITGNTALDGGGVFIYNDGQDTTLNFNRIKGNTATGTGITGLANYLVNGGKGNGAVDARYNFWGCNGEATGSGCDTSAAEDGATTPTVSPYAAVTASFNSTTPQAGSTLTLTGGIFKDSTGAALANLNAFTGVSAGTTTSSGATETIPAGQVSAAFTIKQGSTILNSGTVLPPANAQGTLSTTTASTAGAGTGVVAIDNATVTAVYTPVVPPGIAAAFAKAQILVGGTDTLTFTIRETSGAAQTGVAFSGMLPAGLTVSSTNGLSNGCNGTAAAAANGMNYSLSGGTLAASGTCTLSFSVTGGSIASYTVTSGTVSSTSGGTGTTASASVNVVAVPVLALATVTSPFNRGTQLVATYTVTAGSLAPTTTFQFFAGATQIGTATATATNSTTYTATYTTGATLGAGTQTLLAKYPGDTNYPAAATNSQSVLVIANDVWVGNGNGTTSGLYVDGTALVSNAETSGGTAVAIDSSGNVWSVSTSGNKVAKYTSAGAVTSSGYTGGGLSSPTALAIDGLGQVWITNMTNSISVFANSGTAVSPTAYTGGLLAWPTSITIDSSGNLWIANHGASSVTEVLGAAAPTIQPLSTAVSTNTTGTEP